jgi:hypothetical protein
MSQITEQLIQQLRERDAKGLAKYGTTLDRTDLSPQQWLQHLIEELLDGAGYALKLKAILDTTTNEALMKAIFAAGWRYGRKQGGDEVSAAEWGEYSREPDSPEAAWAEDVAWRLESTVPDFRLNPADPASWNQVEP